jgi:aminoglycoside phosphotransferase (APT) family kinase protein
MTKMHDDEIASDAALVRRLLAAQFPQWAELDITPVASSGTDNAMYRLGAEMAVRLPRHLAAAPRVEKERRWLPVIAPHLPLAIPLPLARGAPGADYPLPWSVCRWLGGEPAEPVADARHLAMDLAAFIMALRKIDTRDAPAPGKHNFWRGVPLVLRDAVTGAAIAALAGEIDTRAATAAWERDRDAPAWPDAPLWIHGDLSAGNLLTADGRLCAVIDFGGLAVGDPACDLIVAWSLFAGPAQAVFRESLAADAASWARGRGWALSTALVALPYYRDSNRVIAANARRIIAAVLADHLLGG